MHWYWYWYAQKWRVFSDCVCYSVESVIGWQYWKPGGPISAPKTFFYNYWKFSFSFFLLCIFQHTYAKSKRAINVKLSIQISIFYLLFVFPSHWKKKLNFQNWKLCERACRKIVSSGVHDKLSWKGRTRGINQPTNQFKFIQPNNFVVIANKVKCFKNGYKWRQNKNVKSRKIKQYIFIHCIEWTTLNRD